MYLQSGGNNIVLDGCAIHDQADGHGIQAYSDNVTIRNSIIANNNGQGIYALGSNLVIYNNLFVNNGMGPYDSGANPSDVYGTGVFVTGSNVQLYHNTFYTPAPTVYQAGVYLRNRADVRNNLFLNVARSANRFLVQAASGQTLAGNLCTMATAGCGIVESTMARIVRDAGAGDLHLATGSPAIGAGVFIPAAPTDKDGLTREGKTDLGAYVFSGTQPGPGPGPKPAGVPVPTNLRAIVQP
jgi:hypothetical protein